jgi:hypothetical protein
MEQLRSRSRSSSAPSRKRHSKQCANGEKTPRGHTTTPSTRECALALHTIHSGPGANSAAASAATTRSPAQAADGRRRRPHRLRLSPGSLPSPASGGRRTPDSGRARPGRAASRLRGRPIPAPDVDEPFAWRSISSCDDARRPRGAQEGPIGPLVGVLRPFSPTDTLGGLPSRRRCAGPSESLSQSGLPLRMDAAAARLSP